MFFSQHNAQKEFPIKTSLAFICSFFLSVCSVEGLAKTSDQESPSLREAISIASDQPAGSFTAVLLPDGAVLLTWPPDPSATSYIVVVNGILSTRLPASELSNVVESKGNSASNGRFSIFSLNASGVRSKWVSRPTFLQPEATPVVTEPVEEPAPVVELAPIEVAPPIVEAAPIEEAPPIVEAAPIEVAPPIVEPAPIEVAPPIVEPAPIEVAPPIVEAAPIEVAPPIVELAPIEEAPPAEEPAPIVVAPPVEEPAPIVEAPPIEEVAPIKLVNLAPDITDTSYNCDPVSESVTFTVGQTDYFTLSVTDESALTLTYSVDSSKQGIVNVEVDENGVFTLSSLQMGSTFLWLSAEDNQGLVDEYELRVVVQ